MRFYLFEVSNIRIQYNTMDSHFPKFKSLSHLVASLLSSTQLSRLHSFNWFTADYKFRSFQAYLWVFCDDTMRVHSSYQRTYERTYALSCKPTTQSLVHLDRMQHRTSIVTNSVAARFARSNKPIILSKLITFQRAFNLLKLFNNEHLTF